MTRLRAAQRAEVGHLLDQLIKPESEREAQVQEFVQRLPRKAAKAVERLQGLAPGASIDGWFAALGQAADRAGLLACDDVGAAARMLARLGGEELAVSPDGAVALGQVAGGAELVRFFLVRCVPRAAIYVGGCADWPADGRMRSTMGPDWTETQPRV